MAVGKKSLFAVVFLAVFVVIFVIGVINQISLWVCLNRALIAAIIFTVILWALERFISRYVIPDIIVTNNAVEQKQALGNNLDITIAETSSEKSAPEIPSDINSSGDDSSDKVSDLNLAGQNSPTPEFIPITTKQIDPQVQKIIKSDPERLAEIVKKMGFEE